MDLTNEVPRHPAAAEVVEIVQGAGLVPYRPRTVRAADRVLHLEGARLDRVQHVKDADKLRIFFCQKGCKVMQEMLLEQRKPPPPDGPPKTHIFDTLDTREDASRIAALERELKRIGNVISIFAHVSVITSIVCMAITGGIFFTSSTLSQDRKVFFMAILGVCFLGLLTVIFVSRNHPATLLLFNILLGLISAFTLGISISYA